MKRPPRTGASTGSASRPAPRALGFRHAARLVEDRIRAAGESRGFAVARLLTHWDEIVGPETARLARPLKLSWGRGKRSAGLGATLTLATSGAAAPMVQMLAPQIRDRVNACLGHAAVARIALSQTADAVATDVMASGGVAAGPAPVAGFAEAQASFCGHDDGGRARAAAAVSAQAARAAEGVRDPGLRAALEALARNVLSRDKQSTREEQSKGPIPTCNAP